MFWAVFCCAEKRFKRLSVSYMAKFCDCLSESFSRRDAEVPGKNGGYRFSERVNGIACFDGDASRFSDAFVRNWELAMA
jgi:hypothetical protein